jgi:hypothetical protein
MLDPTTIVSIVSIIVSALVAGHYAVRSKCFGFLFSFENGELEIRNSDIDIEVKRNEKGNLELDINKVEILEVPLSK